MNNDHLYGKLVHCTDPRCTPNRTYQVQLVLKQNLLSIFSEGDDSCLTVSVDDCKILSKEEVKNEEI